MRPIVLRCALLGVAVPALAQAQTRPDTLTAERIVALARARAPHVRIAESEVVAARGRLSGARALGRENPTVEGVASTEHRFERRTQWELNLPVGIGLHWAGRNRMAGAELHREQHLVADARRGAVGAALAAYYRVLHAALRVDLASERTTIATDLVETAHERHRSGQIPRLELLLTETENARAASELLREQQALARARIELAAALGLASLQDVAVAGLLVDRSVLDVGQVGRPRADVLAAESELRAARAARALGRMELLPGLAFRLHYGHEGGEPVVQPGVAVTVPLFQHGQESRQVARARELRAQAELDRLRSASAAEREGFREAYQSSIEAADGLGRGGLPRVEEAEAMSRESYKAGKMDLPSLLIVRRELLDARREHLDRLLDAALAGVDLAVAEGRFQ